jgi:hypothetical protein
MLESIGKCGLASPDHHQLLNHAISQLCAFCSSDRRKIKSKLALWEFFNTYPSSMLIAKSRKCAIGDPSFGYGFIRWS